MASTTDPQKSGELMLEAAKQSVKSTKRMQSLNLVKGLRVRRLGTNGVEKMAKELVQDDVRNEGVVIKLMDIVVKSSEEKANKARLITFKSMKKARACLPAGRIL